jgi:hypothetical protein
MSFQVAVEEARAEAVLLKAKAEVDLRRAHAAREEANTHELAARRAIDEATAQEAVARASIQAAQRAQDNLQQIEVRGAVQLEALQQELHAKGGGGKKGLSAPPASLGLPLTQPSKGGAAAAGPSVRFGEELDASLRSQLKMAHVLDHLRNMDRQRAEERRRADQLRFGRRASLPPGAKEGAPGADGAAGRPGGTGLLAALRADPPGASSGLRPAADTFLMLSSSGGPAPAATKRARPNEGTDEGAGYGGPGLGPLNKVNRSSLGGAKAHAEEGLEGWDRERASAGLAEARDFLHDGDGEAGGGGEAALAAERSIKDAELVMRAELAVLQNLVPHLARQFGERKFRVLVIAAVARQWDDTWRLCLSRRKGKGFRLQLPMCGLEAGLELLGGEPPDTLPLARKLARDSLGEGDESAVLSSPAGYSEPVRYTEELKDGSLTIALIHPLLVSAAEASTPPGTSYHRGDTFVSWCRADALVPVVRDVPQKFSATFPRVLKCLELLMTNPMEGWPLPQLLRKSTPAHDVLG